MKPRKEIVDKAYKDGAIESGVEGKLMKIDNEIK